MKTKTIYYKMDGTVDKFATWVNNSPAFWVILSILFIICGIVEGL